jgi:regulator of sigma E protease
VNLLPIPVLDGGLILFALIALIFRRRVPDKVIEVLSMGFMYALIALMCLLIVKDSWRSWRIHSYKPGPVEQLTEGDAAIGQEPEQ